ncbi:MAG: YncE family protein, partial [Minisyncoccia bacterium]
MKNQHAFISVFFPKKMWEVRKKIFQIGVGGLLLLFPFFASAAITTSIIIPSASMNTPQGTPVSFSATTTTSANTVIPSAWTAMGSVASPGALWVTASSYGQVYKIDTTTNTIVGTYNVGGAMNYDVAYASPSNSIWVTNQGTNTVTKLNATNGNPIGTYNTGSSPIGIAYASSSNSIWIANNGGSSVTKLNAANGALVGTYALGGPGYAVAFDSFTNSVWVTNGSNVRKFNATTGAVVGTYSPGAGMFSPDSVVFDSFTNSIWVGDSFNGKLGKLNASNGASVAVYNVGTAPNGAYINDLAYNPVTHAILVPDSIQGVLRSVDVSTGSITGTYTVDAPDTYLTAVTYSPTTNAIWVSSYSNNVIK